MSMVTLGSRLIPMLCRGNSSQFRARNTVWKVAATSAEGGASIKCAVRSLSASDAPHQSQSDGGGHTESGASAADAFRKIVISRTSGHRFSGREIDIDVLRDIMALTQSSPSAFNVQPWSVVLVRHTHSREILATAMLGANEKKVKAAPLLAVFCADLEPSKRLPRMEELQREAGMTESYRANTAMAVNLFSGEGVVGNVIRNVATSAASPLAPAPQVYSVEAWSFKNTALAVQTYMLACSAYGMTTAPMEGFDARRVRTALDIPDRYAIPMVVATGYPEPSPTDRGRKGERWRYPPREIVFDGTFGVPLEGVEPVVP